MNTDSTVAILDRPMDAVIADAAPSADFVRAVSDFFDTDPADLLSELGYYDRSGGAEARALSDSAALPS